MTHEMGEGYIRDLPRSAGLGQERFGLPGGGIWEGKGCG